VTFGLLAEEARQMPDLRLSHQALWEDWVAKLTDMVGVLQERGICPRSACGVAI